MAEKTESAFKFDTERLRARDMAAIGRMAKQGLEAYEHVAHLLARVAVSGDVDGDVSDPEFWLDMSKRDVDNAFQALVGELSGKN